MKALFAVLFTTMAAASAWADFKSDHVAAVTPIAIYAFQDHFKHLSKHVPQIQKIEITAGKFQDVPVAEQFADFSTDVSMFVGGLLKQCQIDIMIFRSAIREPELGQKILEQTEDSQVVAEVRGVLCF